MHPASDAAWIKTFVQLCGMVQPSRWAVMRLTAWLYVRFILELFTAAPSPVWEVSHPVSEADLASQVVLRWGFRAGSTLQAEV